MKINVSSTNAVSLQKHGTKEEVVQQTQKSVGQSIG
jgi:hypothetical protein